MDVAWTVGQRGWKGVKNRELLALAENEFDIFVTVDKGIPHQQDLDCFDLLFILLQARSNAYPELASCMDDVNAAISEATSTPETGKKVTRISS